MSAATPACAQGVKAHHRQSWCVDSWPLESSQVLNDQNMARRWLEAGANPVIAGALEAVYAEVARQIERRGPACWASGRCCNFEQAGHRLYVTGLEAAYTLARAPAELRVTMTGIAGARARGGCPFQSGNLCGVHAIKPLGCRVYFCDRSAQAWQQELSERMLGEIRGLHDRFRVEYRYGEWRSMLEAIVPFVPSGVGPVGAAPGDVALPVLPKRAVS